MAAFVRRSGAETHRANEGRPVRLSENLVTVAAPQRPDLPDRIAGRTRRGGRGGTRPAQAGGARRAAQDSGRAPKPPGGVARPRSVAQAHEPTAHAAPRQRWSGRSEREVTRTWLGSHIRPYALRHRGCMVDMTRQEP